MRFQLYKLNKNTLTVLKENNQSDYKNEQYEFIGLTYLLHLFGI